VSHRSPIPYAHRTAYWNQRRMARCRRIGFKFTVQDWIVWWVEQLGSNWFELRGRGAGKYCMARKGDKGPYERGNIKCITNRTNTAEREEAIGSACACSKLTEKQVLEIRASKEPLSLLAKRYKVVHNNIWLIRARKTWKHI
jgi:hypothetical protein